MRRRVGTFDHSTRMKRYRSTCSRCSTCRRNIVVGVCAMFVILTINRPVLGMSQSSPSSATAKPVAPSTDHHLDFFGSLACGAISRSLAKVLLHPANTAKTIAQTRGKGQNRVIAEAALEGLYIDQSGKKVVTAPTSLNPMSGSGLKVLFRGAGAQFILSSFLGAANFAVLEQTRKVLDSERFQSMFVPNALRTWRDNHSCRDNAVAGATKDFAASIIATSLCSVLSIPHAVIMDNIMAGTPGFRNLAQATQTLSRGGMKSYYKGGWAHVFGKVPAYAISWSCFQHLKRSHFHYFYREASNRENAIMGGVASGVSVCILMPYENVKTRLVTGCLPDGMGITSGFAHIFRQEGPRALYSGTKPRLVSVVPMLAIQMTLYEACKRAYIHRSLEPDNALGGEGEY